jgi:hypothetical protein
MKKLIIVLSMLCLFATPIMASEITGNLSARVIPRAKVVMVSQTTQQEQIKLLMIKLQQLLIQLRDLLQYGA